MWKSAINRLINSVKYRAKKFYESDHLKIISLEKIYKDGGRRYKIFFVVTYNFV
jgi:hypothetical protein